MGEVGATGIEGTVSDRREAAIAALIPNATHVQTAIGCGVRIAAAHGDGFTARFGGVAVAHIGRLPDRAGRPLETLAVRFRDGGERGIDALADSAGATGSFALALFDDGAAAGVVAVDRFATHPVFFHTGAEGIAFGDAPLAVAAVAGIAPQLDLQSVFDYLHGHVVPAPRSIVRGVSRLLPGECVEWRNGRARVRRYWSANFDEARGGDLAELRNTFLTALRDSVREAANGARCGTFLSGGTDSSTITGLLAQSSPAPVDAFSIGFAAEGFDEMHYARVAAKHFGVRHHERYVTPADIAAAAPTVATAHPQPFGNASALPTYFCAQLAHDQGIERLLGGDGGDELFGGNARYAKQAVFGHYARMPAALRSGLIEPACAALEKLPRLPGIGKAVSYVQQARMPMPDRLDTYNLLTRLGHDRVLGERLREQIDPDEPARLNREVYAGAQAASLINRMLALDFKTTLADNDLPKVMRSCALAGVDVSFPMLDARVVDFSLRLAPQLKLKGTQLRWFFKQAVRDLLPAEIIHKTKHGFGLPFGAWVMADPALKALCFDTLDALKHRGLVAPAFIDELKHTLLPQHPNYYGAMAWLLMSLQLWLAAHWDTRRGAAEAL
jgi:asparagine synthase (glutamine-hydrolysing)